jgi:hypothetical protein
VNDSLVNGTPKYFAWYELFGDESSSGAKGPDYYTQPLPSNYVVEPGDTISAEVSFVPGGNSREFLFQMADPTQGWTWSLDQTMEYVTPPRGTAEWIIEGPSANFGEVTFTGAWATVNSATGPINPLQDLLAISTTYSDGAPRTTTSNPPVIANSLGYNEPASGHQSSSFTVFYYSDTGSSDSSTAQRSTMDVNAASSGLAALDSHNFNTGNSDIVAAAQQSATDVNAASSGLAALDSEEEVEPQSLIAPIASNAPRSEATAVTLKSRSTSSPAVSPASGVFTRAWAFRGQRVVAPSLTWSAILN